MNIATRAARDVEGIARPLRARVVSSPEGTVLDLDVAIWLGAQVVEVCRTAQLHVRKVLEYTTGLNMQAVNVNARSMLMAEQPGSVPAASERSEATDPGQGDTARKG
jgi:uncharacterized alkaline shock family protein YloU